MRKDVISNFNVKAQVTKYITSSFTVFPYDSIYVLHEKSKIHRPYQPFYPQLSIMNSEQNICPFRNTKFRWKIILRSVAIICQPHTL